MATLGLDTSVYEQGIEEAKAQTKTSVATMTKDYNRLYSSVLHLTAAYQKSSRETGENSKATRDLKEKLKEAQSQLNATAQGLKTAEQYMASFSDETKTAAGNQQSFTEKLTGAITKANILSSAVQTAAGKIKDFAEAFVLSGIEYNAQIETYTTGLTNVLGSAEAAQKAMNQIQQDAARTPFNVDSLVSANQYLISAGENAAYARKTILALGDAVAATGGGSDELNRMAQNLQQIANTGKATAVDIKQFAYAGINVYGILADYTGKSTAEVQKMTVSYDLLTKALQAASEEGGRYYNSMDTQSQTMNGRVSTLKDNVKQLAGLMTGDLADGLGIVISNLNDMTVAAQEAYKKDGWVGLAGAITGLTEPINHAKTEFQKFTSIAVTELDKLSFRLNKLLGKTAYAEFDTYEEYSADKTHKSNRERRRKEALAGKGISTKSWTERQQEAAESEDGGSSITADNANTVSSGSSSGGSTAKTITETVLSAQTDAATSYTQNAFGRVTTATSELTEKILKSDGTSYDRLTKTVTESGKEMVNGVVKNYKTITKTVTGENNKVTSTTQKVYEDASQTLIGTLTQTAQSVKDGISTTIETVTQSFADGSSQLVQTTTETGKRIVNGVLETYTKVKKIAEDGSETTSETSQAIVSQYDTLNSNYGEAAKNVTELTQLYNESVAETGEFSDQTKRLAAMLAEAEENFDSAKSALKEYEKTTSRTYVQTKKLTDLIKTTNSDLSDFGSTLTELGSFFDSDLIQDAGEFFTTITDGVEKVINFTTSTATLVTTLQELKTTLETINTTGGLSGLVSGVGKLMGIGTTTAAAGSAASGLAGAAVGQTAAAGTAAAGSAAAGTGLAALGLSIPQIGLIIAGVLGIGAVGYGIYKWATKNTEKTAVATEKSSRLSYTDIQDAYWYGNERAFAGYDYRTDPYTFGTVQTPMKTYQDKMQMLMESMTQLVEEYLPKAGNNVLAIDGEEFARIITPRVNENLGQLSILSGRGN